ncbi:RNA-binding S4 domain-containing protein [Hyphococcus luteus]|uniref:RNA-binding protein n=1 Tax=Hyphococcus luteus TaxID=2058213 RepID=A0A2S7K8R8_9PROT|nr:RNA-binding S4 domain-containing protein [Marinicaulis flavus]PQA88904.1 RNA-binding protein [Marinicaulis flavus]
MTAATAASDPSRADKGQRLDKWLWQARFFKTRTIAAKFVSDGNVRVSRGDATARLDKPSASVRPGDVIVFTRNERLRIIHILACAERRGPASEAQTLYEDRSPPPPKEE